MLIKIPQNVSKHKDVQESVWSRLQRALWYMAQLHLLEIAKISNID